MGALISPEPVAFGMVEPRPHPWDKYGHQATQANSDESGSEAPPIGPSEFLPEKAEDSEYAEPPGDFLVKDMIDRSEDGVFVRTAGFHHYDVLRALIYLELGESALLEDALAESGDRWGGVDADRLYDAAAEQASEERDAEMVRDAVENFCR